MARWSEVEDQVPDLAARATELFALNRHKTMATLRADGAPRISGTELEMRLGDMWIGSMTGARKAIDLQRDGRLAIHSASIDPGPDNTDWPGDAKVSGVAFEVHDHAVIAQWAGDQATPPPGGFHLFRIDVHELVLTALNARHDALVVDWWSETTGIGHAER